MGRQRCSAIMRLGGSSGTKQFLYDCDGLVAEYINADTLLRRYAHCTNIDDPVFRYEGSGYATPRILHTNWQGSVVAVTDSSASSIATNSYDEWGIPAATNQGRFQYTGQAWVSEIGWLISSMTNSSTPLKV